MPWGPEDWAWWIDGDREGAFAAPAPSDVLEAILAHLPALPSRAVARLAAAEASRSRLPELGRRFDGVVQLAGAGRRFDVVIAERGLHPGDPVRLDAALAGVHGTLVEGGLLLAVVPASERGGPAREMRLRRAGPSAGPAVGTHEVELQYRLRRAGFRGVRIRRVTDDRPAGPDEGPAPEVLVCIAARRANN